MLHIIRTVTDRCKLIQCISKVQKVLSCSRWRPRNRSLDRCTERLKRPANHGLMRSIIPEQACDRTVLPIVTNARMYARCYTQSTQATYLAANSFANIPHFHRLSMVHIIQAMAPPTSVTRRWFWCHTLGSNGRPVEGLHETKARRLNCTNPTHAVPFSSSPIAISLAAIFAKLCHKRNVRGVSWLYVQVWRVFVPFT